VTPPTTTITSRRPELVAEGFAKEPSPRWIGPATSADHKVLGLGMITGAFGFLFVAVVELLLMRLQLAIPENTFLAPQVFDRLLSLYGETAIFFFALPLAVGFFYYLVPLQIGARVTALPRLGQTGFWLWAVGGAVLYISLVYTPPETGVNPLPPLSDIAFTQNNGPDVWLTSAGLATLGMVFISIDLIATLRTMRAPGMAWRRMPVFTWAAAISSWLLLVIGPVMLAAITMLMIDRNLSGVFFDAGAGGAPLLWEHLSWIFYTGAYMLILIFALGALAEIVPAFARRPLFHRQTVIRALAAVAVIGTLAWMQNMLSAPIGIGWKYFAMLASLALIVPFGLILLNLIGTMIGGTLRIRAPLLFGLGAISLITIGLASEIGHSMVAVAWQLRNTTDSTAATHYALVGGGVFGGFAALHYWYPKLTGRTMGESLARISFWTMFAGINIAFFPLFLAGLEGQVIDAYKFFDGTGVNAYNLIATVGTFILAIGIVMNLVNAILSRHAGPVALPDQWGGESLEWFASSPPPAHNFDVLPDVRSQQPLRDIRDSVARRTADGGRRERAGEPVASER
jgi:cytochrome c oxidase subunit 1